MRRTKVVATLGPATDSPQVMERIIAAGVDVVRLNAAHSGPTELEPRLAAVRAAASAVGSEIAVLLDLPGPKIRVGEMVQGTVLEDGAAFRLLDEDCIGDREHACVTHLGLAGDVHTGDRILLDDGRIELKVTGAAENEVITQVVSGGPLSSNKGVNVPGVTLSVDAITDYDRSVLAWALEADIDWIGQSFVRSAADVEALRALMTNRLIPIVAKIEKHEAIAEIERIILAADGVMVARGDLAVETAPEQVPVLQRQIVRAARDAGRPVVVATEMLDSMRTRRRPTRAEASDVANAIFTRADAVMLSGETAVGDYPVESVETMVRIIEAAEKAALPPRPPLEYRGLDDVQTAVSSAVCELATDLEAAAIVPLTQSGATAFAVSRHRPESPIVAATPTLRTARKLAIAWGVRSVVLDFSDDFADLLDQVVEAVCDGGFVRTGDRVTLTAGLWSRTPGGTDFIHVRTA
ncbi:MAG TPA: pyruvate kinase [Coriobacteriia bacterium]|nr:pyruvate kinase [Coriobacteriia bacterium]